MDVLLVGAGVVGQAILRAHLDAGIGVTLADVNRDALISACNRHGQREPVITELGFASLCGVDFVGPQFLESANTIVIESIAEKLQVKQQFHQAAQAHLGSGAVLCTNTSTLRIRDVADGLPSPGRLLGMHFFMPVQEREAVEIVPHKNSDPCASDLCQELAIGLGKTPLRVRDSPGFIVNRLLSPYLNQALLMLAHGIDHMRIEQAAKAFGMPISPLELIDLIGSRTMFDAGRAFWQAFPNRLDPSPIVPALIKSGRLGRSVGAGLYDYDSGQRSEHLSEQARELIDRYRLDPISASDTDVMSLLAIPMWIESQIALRDEVAESQAIVDLAMQGGLGYRDDQWSNFFDRWGTHAMTKQVDRWSDLFRSMQNPLGL